MLYNKAGTSTLARSYSSTGFYLFYLILHIPFVMPLISRTSKANKFFFLVQARTSKHKEFTRP